MQRATRRVLGTPGQLSMPPNGWGMITDKAVVRCESNDEI